MARNQNGLDNNVAGFFKPSGVASDISRPYLFRIDIPVISQIAQDFQSRGLLTAWARTAQLPKYTLGTKEIKFQSQTIRLAGPPTYDNWSVQFLLDEQHTLRHAFLAWMQLTYDAHKMKHAAPKDYKRNDCKVIQLSKSGQPISTYNFVGLYPTNVGETSLDHASTEPGNFTVEFAYDYFVIGIGGTSTEAAAEDQVGNGTTVNG